MELKPKEQPQKYLVSTDAPTHEKLYQAPDSLSRLEGDIVLLKGYANRYRYKILHYCIAFEWIKDEIVITVIEINIRTNIKHREGFSMNQPLSPIELGQRFAEINVWELEESMAKEAVVLAEVETMNDDDSVPLNAFEMELERYDGRLAFRIPRSLHKHLKEEAEIEGVSLDQYVLYKLSR